MPNYCGDYAVNSTVNVMLTTNAAAGAAVAPSSAFEAADIIMYKDNSATQRTSQAGWTMTSPFDSLTGLHQLSIDTSDNTDAGFYAAGHDYFLVLSPDTETVDSQTVIAVVGHFSIQNRGGLAADTRNLLALPAAAPQAAGGLITSAAGSLDVDDLAADVDATETRVTTALPNAAPQAAGGLITSIAGSLDLDEMNADIEAIQTSTGGITFTVAGKVDANVLDWNGQAVTNLRTYPLLSNVNCDNFEFQMVLAADHVSPGTAATAVVQVSIDGGAYGNAVNSPATLLANGTYVIDLDAADLNGSVVTLRATAGSGVTLADPTTIPLFLAG